MNLPSLVSLLSDGEFHSGSELGEALNVSRTAVWKALSGLEQFGLQVESVKGKGYRLTENLELIDLSELELVLSQAFSDRVSVDLSFSVDSTNSAAMSAELEADYHLVLAEMQTSGRGRRGRVWQSPFAKNLYMSLAFHIDGGPQSIAGLSLVAGLSIANTIKALGDLPLKLKWPNDLMINDQKLAGILVELQGEPSTQCKVVLGVGLNVEMTTEAASEIDQPWCNLVDHINVGRNQLLQSLVKNLIADLDRFKREGFKEFVDQWNELDYFAGQEVVVLGGSQAGQSMGVDLLGNLLLESEQGLVAVNAGEVSVRKKAIAD